MARLKSRLERRLKRHRRVRNKVSGTGAMPRLAVFRSAKHISVQAVDDLSGQTLAAASTYEKEIRERLKSYSGNAASAALVGQAIAERLKSLGVERAVFDRGGNLYHGRIQALADGAREAGLRI
jgi:large subunit ribosomal protein L18